MASVSKKLHHEAQFHILFSVQQYVTRMWLTVVAMVGGWEGMAGRDRNP